jgi:hypothetical protein
MEDKQQQVVETAETSAAAAAVDELQAKLKAQEDELGKLRQLNELLLERMNKKDKRSIKSATSVDSAADQQEYEGFDVKKVPVRHRETNEIIDHDHIVTIKDAQLIQYVRNWVVRTSTLNQLMLFSLHFLVSVKPIFLFPFHLLTWHCVASTARGHALCGAAHGQGRRAVPGQVRGGLGLSSHSNEMAYWCCCIGTN